MSDIFDEVKILWLTVSLLKVRTRRKVSALSSRVMVRAMSLRVGEDLEILTVAGSGGVVSIITELVALTFAVLPKASMA